ncbi:MAG: succinate dehydrogenase, cytochrome b556 subunit [bacterium]|nr:succinate dehydrogenase, cytochrome b556 subunit [bacterium]
MTSLVTTITETLRYRGAIGQWSWVLHRVTGLGVVFFLTLHVIDTSWALFYPELYVEAIAVYQTPLFTLGEFGLVACVVYHALNGMRIAIFDFRPELWKYQARAAQLVILATVLILIPVFLIMFGHVLAYYNESPQVLGLVEVISSQLKFGVGIGAAIVAAVILAILTQPFLGNNDKTKGRPRASRLEKFWWSFMRVSGLAILPLVFGHLAMMHLVQGVFDITAQNYPVVGTNMVNASGTAVEFVANRWNFLFAGVAVWRIYDMALLILVTVHGFNGLRYVLTDYTTQSPVLRRAAAYLCTIGAAVLLAVGGGALIGTIPQDSIALAEEAYERLYGGETEGEGVEGAVAP